MASGYGEAWRRLAVGPRVDLTAVMEPLRARARSAAQTVTRSSWSGTYAHALPSGIDFNRFLRQETRDRLAQIGANIIRAALPPNLKDIDGVTLSRVLVVLDEGFPLYGVPQTRVAARLLRAPDMQARRRVIGQEYDAILAGCADVLARVGVSPLAYERDSIAEAIELAGSGHPRAAQALAANVMDSLAWMWLREHGIAWEDWGHLTRRRGKGKTDEFMDEWMLAAMFAWRPVWVSFEGFKPWEGDLAPTTFNRNASLHAVSRRQYNKRNTAIAIMLATSLLNYLLEWGNHPAR